MPMSSCVNSVSGRRAASRMNRLEIRSTCRFSLKSTMCSIVTQGWFARTMPISVTANSPDSCWKWSAPTNTASPIARAKLDSRKSGSRCARPSPTNSAAPPIPNRPPQRKARTRPEIATAALPPSCPSTPIVWNTSTARIAPKGSVTMPSQRTTEPTPPAGRT